MPYIASFRVCILSLTLLSGALCQAALELHVAQTNPHELTLTWPGSAVLEQADSAAGPWHVVDGAVSGWRTSTDGNGAFFRLRSVFSLEVTLTGDGSGRVASDPAGIACGADCTALFDAGTEVTLTAEAEPGSQFVGWNGQAGATDPLVVLMDQARSITASFERASTTILVNGDFEQGPGVGWIEQPGPLIVPAATMGVLAWSGQYVARLGYESDNRHEAILRQVITLPPDPPLYLHLSVWIYSEEICDVGYYDLMGAYINGIAIEENASLCRSDNTDGWVRNVMDLSPYAGQQIELGFRIFANAWDPLASIVLLDGLEINQSPF